MWLPYVHLVSKILEHVGFNVKDEESEENFAEIGNVSLVQMRIDFNDGVTSQNPLNVKKNRSTRPITSIAAIRTFNFKGF